MCSFAYSSTVGYSPANNIFTSDNQYATASHCDCCDQNTQCLFATGFGFSIPLSATINGIVVEIEKRASPNATIQDNALKLLKNNVELGTDHASPNPWGMSDQYYSYGSSTDLWGSTWTPSEINAPGFGVGFASISYTCFGNGPAATSYIDHIRVTVHYTDMSTGISNMVSGDGFQVSGLGAGQFMIRLPDPTKTATMQVFNSMGQILFDDLVYHNQVVSLIPAKGLLLFRSSQNGEYRYIKFYH